jgi:hypothetical protein
LERDYNFIVPKRCPWPEQKRAAAEAAAEFREETSKKMADPQLQVAAEHNLRVFCPQSKRNAATQHES